MKPNTESSDNSITKMNSEAAKKHEFEVADCYRSLTDKILLEIVQTVNEIHKGVSIVKLDSFTNHFLVRNGHSKEAIEILYEEDRSGVVENLGYVTLRAKDDEKKKVIFGLWHRVGLSKVLI